MHEMSSVRCDLNGNLHLIQSQRKMFELWVWFAQRVGQLSGVVVFRCCDFDDGMCG